MATAARFRDEPAPDEPAPDEPAPDERTTDEPDELSGVFGSHSKWVSAVAFSVDGRRIASASGDGHVSLWSAADTRQLLSFAAHPDPVGGIAWSPDGTRIATGSWDATVKIWDSFTGAELIILRGHGGPVNGIAWSPDGNRIVSASDDRTARIWDLGTHRRLRSLRGHRFGLNAVAWSPDGSRIVTASGHYSENFISEADNALIVWNAMSGGKSALLEGHRNVVRSLAWSPDGSRIVSGGDDWTVRVWDAADGTQLADFLGHRGAVWAVACSPDGTRIASGSSDATIRIWEAARFVESHTFRHPPAGVEVATLLGHRQGVYAVAWSPHGDCIASGSADLMLRLWDAHTFTPLDRTPS